ncbi:MAG: alpha/beta hydrolase [Candidatus Woesearchaeota archaeon]
MKQKPQLFLIHGGMTFKNQRDYTKYLKTREITLEKTPKWHDTYLDKKLGGKFQIIRPRFPLSDNAQYEDWKIIFERYIPLLNENVILIGRSLGGIFLAKYLSENKFPKKITATYLIAAPFDNTLTGEDLVGGFELKSNLSLLEKNSPNLKLLFSKTDDVVPVSHAEKYKEKLKSAEIIIYTDKNGHFKIEEFPEIIKMLKLDYKIAKKN